MYSGKIYIPTMLLVYAGSILLKPFPPPIAPSLTPSLTP